MDLGTAPLRSVQELSHNINLSGGWATNLTLGERDHRLFYAAECDMAIICTRKSESESESDSDS